ncbi:MAG: SDR family oxidoreductase [Gemmatimonadaceae bacterium]|nr:SDR family oxidoreductase [Gemmatimonadaceae bacterium]
MQPDFAGRVALVTGGTRGIGLAVAEQLAERGASVHVTGRDATREESRALGRRSGWTFHAVDYADPAAVGTFIDAVVATTPFDVLVNNAGINRVRPIAQTRLDDWRELQAVNLEAPLRLTMAVADGMQRRRYGRIVNISSIFGVVSKAHRALYSISKFGIRGLTIASALELAPHGVLVNAMAPGFVRTELTASILSEAEQEALARQVPMGRFAEAGEIARVICFLASEANSYITGQTIVADGGFTSG